MSEESIAVYRLYQSTLVSPCTLGDPCRVCALHASCHAGDPCKGCRRGKAYECERAYPANPAFAVKFSTAMRLVNEGLATFIHRNTALQLTFAKLIPLRDVSCKADEELSFEYVLGLYRARVAFDVGWRPRLHPKPKPVPKPKAERRKQRKRSGKAGKSCQVASAL